MIKSQQVDHVFEETKILSMIDHPFIVIILNKTKIGTAGFANDDRYFYLVIELVSGGQLYDYLLRVKKMGPEQVQ